MSGIVVFGSINLDYVAQVEALPGPGETIKADSYETLPGGKGSNQAVAAARNEAPVAFVGAASGDSAGDIALSGLAGVGVDLGGVDRTVPATGTAWIAVDAKGENQIIVIGGGNLAVEASWLENSAGSVLVTQNELRTEETLAAHAWAKAQGWTVIHNAAPAHALSDAQVANIDILVVNEHELAALSDLRHASEDQQALAQLKRGAGAVVLTLGALGAVLFEDGDKLHIDPAPATVVDTTGAGDGFVGALAAAVFKGASLVDAVQHANAYAAKVCGVLGAQTDPR